MNFLKNVYAHDLEGYDGDNIHYILDTLRNKHLQDKANNHSSAHPTAAATAADPWHYAMSQPGVYGQQASSRKLLRRRQSEGFARNSMRLRTVVYKGEETLEEDDVGVMRVLMRNGPTVNRDDRVINKHTMQRTTLTPGSRTLIHSIQLKRSPGHPPRRRNSVPSIEDESDRTNRVRTIRTIQSDDEEGPDSRKDSVKVITASSKDSSTSSSLFRNSSFVGVHPNVSDTYYRKYSYADSLLKIAHILHYIGIGILGFFVVQVCVQ